jgi:LemA protein
LRNALEEGTGMTWLWVVLALVALVAIGVVVSYNRFVSQRQLINDAWANIATELRRRYDLIPNLVETVKGYAQHEREVFENVTRARAAAAAATGSPAQQAAAEGPFVAALRQLFAVAENYPQLRANENVKMLQEELAATENKVGFARQFYNDIATKYNTSIEVVPNNIVAGFGSFKSAELFEIKDDAERAVPTVDLSMRK